MKVGHLIRAERAKQEMKQIVLAKGICTPSYLSKIERNLIEPSEEVATLLFNRLGMELGKLQKNDQEKEIEFLNILKGTYKKVITTRDKKFAQQKLDYLEQQNPFFENHSIYYTFLLIVFRFKLILGGDLEVREKELVAMKELSDHFDPYHEYLFKVNKALYYYSAKNRPKAIEYLEDVLSIIDDVILEEWERAELNYMLGVIYTDDGRVYHSIEYIRMALDFFREHFLMSRVLDCYVLIGITRKKSEQYQEAFEAYLKAKQILDEFNLDFEKDLVYHNLGSLNAVMGNSEEAIRYYEKSIQYKADEKSPLISILCLVLEYSKMDNKKLVNEWCNEGISLFIKLNDENLTSYYHHFKFFESLHSDQGLSETIADQAIEYFKDIQDYQHVHKYCIVLADWYNSNRKYKLASIYYQKANRFGYIYRKVKKWEDL